MQLKFRDGTGEHALVVRRHEDHWLVTPDGAPAGVLVREASDGAWLVTRADRTSRRAWVAACGDERLVFCDGVAHRLRRPDPVHADDLTTRRPTGPTCGHACRAGSCVCSWCRARWWRPASRW